MGHVITGGAGFIGSHLADALTARDEKVTVVDNFSRGHMQNLIEAGNRGRLEVVDLDLEREDLPLLEEDDIVWHLAAKVTGIEYNRHNHYDMLTTNLAMTMRVVEAVRRAKPELFVYVSTACIYPHDAPVPTPESAGDIGDPEPTNHGYGVAKWTGEQIVWHLSKEHNVPCIIVRFFNAFGPRDYYDEATSHVAPALIRRVLEGENPVVVWGSGTQTRALVDARDIAKALVMLADKVRAVPRWNWREALVVNIGHKRECTIRELARTIIRLSGVEPKPDLQFATGKPDGYARRAADTKLLEEVIGWVPDTPMEDTLRDMIAEYREGRAWV
jgi:nucleoside-diphosphate-sugar epimerase